MSHRPHADINDRPHHTHADLARATASRFDSLLDHHIEEVLAAFSDLAEPRLEANGDGPA
jgi:hypothetical protein